MPDAPRPVEYTRPYSSSAAWNIPASGLATDPNSDSLVHKLWNYAPSSRPGNFNLSFDDYTYPVYYTTEATGEYRVDTVSWANMYNKSMPWNPKWAAAPGSDAQVIVLDPETGREWNLWQASFDGNTIRASNANLVPGSYFTKSDGFAPSRGVGIQYLAMLVQPEEVAAGAIKHALSMPIKNTAPNYVAPGTKSDGKTNGGIPEGTRFQLTATDAEIENWLDAFPGSVSAATKSSARIIAEALRDYGWFITDTAGGASWQFEANVSAGDLWASLGLGPSSAGGKIYPQDLMDGLLTPYNIRAIVPSNDYGTSTPPPPPSDPDPQPAPQPAPSPAVNTIEGTSGADRLVGTDGNDLIRGGSGNDSLYGEAGNDTFEGGAGDDWIWGGPGADVVRLQPGQGADRWRDFEPGVDKIDLNGLNFKDLKFYHDTAWDNLWIRDASGMNLLALKNIAPGDIGAGDFIG